VRFRALILLPVLAWPLVPASGQGPLLGAQVTVIGQHLFPFSTLYSGPKSLDTTSDTKATHTYGVYLGARVLAHLQAYLDVEMAQGAAPLGTTPDIVADDWPGRTKVGVGLNVEQPLADSGETGLFARAGWNDGRTEDFVFTEADRQRGFSSGTGACATVRRASSRRITAPNWGPM
jgi:hypothetical protein